MSWVIDPSDAVVADSSVHEPDPQNPVRLVVRRFGRTIVVYSTTHEALDELDARRFWEGDDRPQAAKAILESE